jgi:enoyl-[acyl-carrier protein] reductase II
MMKTRITELLNIEFPIVLPGMSWISKPELVAAVSNAGGLGILAMGPLSPEEVRASIQKIKELTDKPFGVGCTLMMPGAKENAEIALEEQVPVINFSLGKGDWLVKKANEYGGKVIATVTTLKHAKSAESIGAHALMVTGHEAAAHGGEVTSLVLVPTIIDAVSIPVIATGGFGDGRGLLAALALGAQGVAMGSRFAVSQESPLHANTKEAILTKTQHDTIYSKNFDGIPARYMKTPTAVRLTRKPMNIISTIIQAIKAASLVNKPVWQILSGLLVMPDKIKLLAYFGAATIKLRAATEDGDVANGMQFIGQTQGLINDIPSVEVIMQRVIAEAKETHQLNQSIFNKQ